MVWYCFLVITKLFSSIISIVYNRLKSCLNVTILFGMWINIASYTLKYIVTQNFSVTSFILIMLLMEFLLCHTLLRFVMLHYWCSLIIPKFILILNGLSESHMLDVYFGLQNTVSVELLSNRISYFILTSWEN